MSKPVVIGLIGDQHPEVIAHRAIPQALTIAASQLDTTITCEWLPTATLDLALQEALAHRFAGLWCVPGSPYDNTDNALSAIRHAREQLIPLLGTCGGYQHMALEYARNRLGLTTADSREMNPDAEIPLITPLVCSLRETSDNIELQADTRIHDFYGSQSIVEKYNCGFGLNRDYLPYFNDSEMIISAFDGAADPRALELPAHPFYIGVAFQPERSALEGQPHPLITAFARRCVKQQENNSA